MTKEKGFITLCTERASRERHGPLVPAENNLDVCHQGRPYDHIRFEMITLTV
jgi:hypothetical protein